MSLSRRAWLILLCATAPAFAQVAVPAPPAVPAEVQAELPGAKLIGSGSLRFFGLRIYDARLWAAAPPTESGWARRPLVLEIEYARTVAGQQIAERSLKEMRRQREIGAAEAQSWLAAMQGLFPDMKAGDRISGVQRPGEASRFFVNGRFAGEVLDAEFTRLFFGVWLSAQTAEPSLRQSLLGLSAGS